MKVLMKYPSGRGGGGRDGIGELRESNGRLYIEESDAGGFFRMYDEAAIEYLEKKSFMEKKEKETLGEVITLLKSKLDGTN